MIIGNNIDTIKHVGNNGQNIPGEEICRKTDTSFNLK